MTSDGKRAHPLLWVPSLYFAMGTPMITVSLVSGIMYKDLGLTNVEIGIYTGALYAPWVFKPLWAPLVELFRTKKFFVLAMECTMVVTLLCVALALKTSAFLPLTLLFLALTGFASATQDIAGDGVYLTSSTPKEQALYIGVQGAAWNLGRVLAAGALVSLTKVVFDWAAARQAGPALGPHPAWFTAWMTVMILVAAILAAAAAYHYFMLPPGSKAHDAATNLNEALRTTGKAWVTFFRKPRVWMMIAVVFFYRFGEGFIEKIGPLFLKDARNVGGLGVDNMVLGTINAIGTVVFVAGTLLGGFIAARLTLRRVFVLLALCLNVPLLTYYVLSITMPTNATLIAGIVFIEKFGYGIGTVGMMLYMMQELSPGPYRTAHYAFATGIMALNMQITGMLSGYVQAALHYPNFFLFVMLAAMATMVIIWLAPFGANPDADPTPAR